MNGQVEKVANREYRRLKVAHITLVGWPYVSSWGYQENQMVSSHLAMGHDVVVIAMANVPPVYREQVDQEDRYARPVIVDDMGVKVYRLPFLFRLPRLVNESLRLYKGLGKILEIEKPDFIFVHDLHFTSVFAVTKYRKKHPGCMLKGDVHATFANSGKNVLSRRILNPIYYRLVVNKAYKDFDEIYFITGGAQAFYERVFKIMPDSRFDIMSIGGILLSAEERQMRRRRVREQHGLTDSEILILHSGKFVKEKRTIDVLDAFSSYHNSDARLFLIGSIPSSQERAINEAIARDARIRFLGWKSSEELRDYLCAADIYLQPGTESATLQTALCCGCPVALNMNANDIGGGYVPVLADGIVYPVENKDDLFTAIQKLSNDSQLRAELSKKALSFAKEKLDYTRQISKLIESRAPGEHI